MITLIYGSKGTGKTKRILDMANASLQDAKGNVVFITDTSRYRTEINYNIRFVNTKEFGIKTLLGLSGFIRGMYAANSDIEYFFIDGAARIAGAKLDEMKEFYETLEKIIQEEKIRESGVFFVLTVSADKSEIPDFLQAYIVD